MKGETNAGIGAQNPAPPDTLQPGTMVDQYQITGVLGRGGMGTVYSGLQPLIGKKVAIKVINREFSGDPEVVARFVQEARAVNTARSRYIVDIFAFGELPDGCHYCIMEHVDGQVLEDILQELDGPMPLARALDILKGITAGLAAAHAMEIVHRDLKPGNILIPSGQEAVAAKLLDFGIAKMGNEPGEASPITRTGMIFGTPAYMAPEQIRSQAVDRRTDIYALGVIMFQLFTGELPFKAPVLIDLVNKHLNDPPPDPADLRPGLPRQLRDLVLSCLEKDPDRRPEGIKQVTVALDLPATAATLLSSTAVEQGGEPVSAAAPAGDLAPPGRTRWLILGIVPLLLAGALFFYFGAPDEAEDPGPRAPAPATRPAPAASTSAQDPAPAPATPMAPADLGLASPAVTGPDLSPRPSAPTPGAKTRPRRRGKPAPKLRALPEPAPINVPSPEPEPAAAPPDLGPPAPASAPRPAPDLAPPPPAKAPKPMVKPPSIKPAPKKPVPRKPAPAKEEVPFGF